MLNRQRQRAILKLIMILGFLLLPVAPLARVMNEGFGDAPGPAEISHDWQQTAFLLMPAAITLILIAGVLLVWLDHGGK